MRYYSFFYSLRRWLNANVFLAFGLSPVPLFVLGVSRLINLFDIGKEVGGVAVRYVELLVCFNILTRF